MVGKHVHNDFGGVWIAKQDDYNSNTYTLVV